MALDPQHLDAQLPELLYAEDRLSALALLVLERPSPLLRLAADDIEATVDWAARRELFNFRRPIVTTAFTFDWIEGGWQRVPVGIDTASECLDAIAKCAPAMFHWSMLALRSVQVLAPKARRGVWWQRYLDASEDQDPLPDTDAWRAYRVEMVSRVLEALRPHVTDRASLLKRGSLLAGTLTYHGRWPIVPLDAAEMLEIERRVP